MWPSTGRLAVGSGHQHGPGPAQGLGVVGFTRCSAPWQPFSSEAVNTSTKPGLGGLFPGPGPWPPRSFTARPLFHVAGPHRPCTRPWLHLAAERVRAFPLLAALGHGVHVSGEQKRRLGPPGSCGPLDWGRPGAMSCISTVKPASLSSGANTAATAPSLPGGLLVSIWMRREVSSTAIRQ